jgi:hypothetical protein
MPRINQAKPCQTACREDIFKEIDILCGLNHENVVYLKEYFEESNKVQSFCFPAKN